MAASDILVQISDNPGAMLFTIGALSLGLRFAIRQKNTSTNTSTTADRGGVAIGGDNHGPINTGTISRDSHHQPASPHKAHWFMHTLAGIGVLCLALGLIYFLLPSK